MHRSRALRHHGQLSGLGRSRLRSCRRTGRRRPLPLPQNQSVLPDYNEQEAYKKYTSCLQSGSGKVNISTFFHLAQQAGISVSIKRRTAAVPPTPPVAEVAVSAEEPPETLPTFSDLVGNDLPDFLKRLVSISNSPTDADILILGTLTSISPCLPNYSGIHDRMRVWNLFLFLTAQASAGKGRLVLCKNIVMPINEKRRAEYARLKEQYDEHMTSFLKSSKKDGVGLMFETEGDTLASTFKSEHGNYSDALRKSFHHESISYNRRKDREFVELKVPRQVLSLIPDAENGLFSRFIFYAIDLALI